MRSLIRPCAVWCVLLAAGLAGSAVAAEKSYEQRARKTLEALGTAVAALEDGDRRSAEGLLRDIAVDVEVLQGMTRTASADAAATEAGCRARSLEIVDKIALTYRDQQSIEAQQADITAQLENATAQSRALSAELATLRTREAQLAEEAKFRRKCQDFGFALGHPRCLKLGLQDIFENRVSNLRKEMGEITQRQRALARKKSTLRQRERDLQRKSAAALSRRADLLAARERLEDLDRAARLATTNLSDVAYFWSRARTALEGDISNRIVLFGDLLPALDEASEGQAFDAYDRRDIRSLRDAILDLGRSMDRGGTVFAATGICQ